MPFLSPSLLVIFIKYPRFESKIIYRYKNNGASDAAFANADLKNLKNLNKHPSGIEPLTDSLEMSDSANWAMDALPLEILFLILFLEILF